MVPLFRLLVVPKEKKLSFFSYYFLSYVLNLGVSQPSQKRVGLQKQGLVFQRLSPRVWILSSRQEFFREDLDVGSLKLLVLVGFQRNKLLGVLGALRDFSRGLYLSRNLWMLWGFIQEFLQINYIDQILRGVIWSGLISVISANLENSIYQILKQRGMRSVDRMRINLCIETNKSPSKEWVADKFHLDLVAKDKRATNLSNTARTRKIYSPEGPFKRNTLSKKDYTNRALRLRKDSNTLNSDRKSFDKYTQQEKPPSDRWSKDNENKCQIIVSENGKKKKLFYDVGRVKDLIDFLKQKDEKIVTYCTVPTNLAYDFYLTKENHNASFFNKKTLHLVPYMKEERKKVDIRSFEIIKCIGAGGFSKVFLVKFKEDGRFYAMKLIDKEFIVKNKKKSIVMNQRNIMIEIHHPFVLPLKFAFESSEFIIFVLEYCPGGELFTYVKKYRKLNQDAAKFFITEILLGIEHLHERNIIYRDIKPENILLDLDGHVRIADFGLAKPDITLQNMAHSFCGSPEYMAPEMILKMGHGRAVDFYCIGALLYELVTGLPPFYSKNTDQIYESALTQQVTFPRHVDLSNECKSLIRGLLQKNFKVRLGSLAGVKEVLAHTWFGRLKRKQVLNKQIIPPIKIDDVESIQFDFGNVKESDYGYISKVEKQQLTEMQVFRKVMGSGFYYDHRVGNNQLKENKQVQEPQPIFCKPPSAKRAQSRNSISKLTQRQSTDTLLRQNLSNREIKLLELTSTNLEKKIRKVGRKESRNVLSPHQTMRS